MEREDIIRLKKFKQLFREKMMMKENVYKVKYFGSTERERDEGKEWESGHSDLDIKVHGYSTIPCYVKIEGVLLVKELNYQIGLGVETAPIQHWTPVYIDDSPLIPPPPLPPLPFPRKELDRLSETELAQKFIEVVRAHVKELVREDRWPFTYKDYWNTVECMSQIERLAPNLSTFLL